MAALRVNIATIRGDIAENRSDIVRRDREMATHLREPGPEAVGPARPCRTIRLIMVSDRRIAC
jgi:hypothetical protein